MSNVFCPCAGGGSSNTGLASGQLVSRVFKKLAFVRLYADDGTRNAIGANDTLNEAYFTALVNHSDPSKRWFPTGEYRNVDMPTPDNITESFADGSSSIVGQNARTFSGDLLNTPFEYIGKLEELACNKFGFYGIDSCGVPIGEESADGANLYPIAVNASSFSAKPMYATDTTVFKLQVGFEIAQTVQDKRLRMIKEDDLGGADLLDLSGLIDVTASAAASITTTGFVTSLTASVGGFISDLTVQGWVLADFALYNDTQDASVTITSVTESPTGTYTFVIPAQTSADVLTLSSAESGDAFVKEGYELTDLTITIP